MKANGKELDPRFFDETERRAFDKSDQKEWQAWLDNHVIEQLGPDAARKVPQARIFKVPARVVRTNKAAAGCKDLLAKSRLVLPGHMDPDVLQGGLRTDSSTIAMTAVRMAMSVALQRRWRCPGKSVARDLYSTAVPLETCLEWELWSCGAFLRVPMDWRKRRGYGTCRPRTS